MYNHEDESTKGELGGFNGWDIDSNLVIDGGENLDDKGVGDSWQHEDADIDVAIWVGVLWFWWGEGLGYIFRHGYKFW